jgi:predicted tellurium resistance membrane protein TerC
MENFDLWSQLAALGQVIAIDLVLAGDNAIVVGMAAAGVPVEQRRKVIFWGVGAAIVLRIFFALITTQLLAIIGLTLAGGVLLLWVCWKMFRELRSHGQDEVAPDEALEAGDRLMPRTPRRSAPRSGRSSSLTSRCRWTTCWRWRVPPRTIRPS